MYMEPYACALENSYSLSAQLGKTKWNSLWPAVNCNIMIHVATFITFRKAGSSYDIRGVYTSVTFTPGSRPRPITGFGFVMSARKAYMYCL